MRELPISSSVRLAWQLAGDFALRCGESTIRPKDLLCGICSLEKVASGGWLAAPKPAAVAEQLRVETQQLIDLAQRHGVGLATVRREIRNASPVWQPPPAAEDVLSRSPEVRKIFQRAEEIARGSGLAEMDLLSLLQALLQSPDEPIAAVMKTSAQGLLDILSELSRVS